MSAWTANLRRLDATGRAGAIARAAGALSLGRLVVAPTETVFGVFALASSAEGARRILAPGAASLPPAWHASDPARVVEALALEPGPQRRAVERLTPGPATLVLERSGARERLDAMDVARGLIADEGRVVVRVPDHPVARALAEAASGPLVARSIADFGLGEAIRAPVESSAWESIGLEGVIDDASPRLDKPSTLVVVARNGEVSIEREGAIPERRIRALLARRILFVCSGNTCRSPMAGAIARAIAGDRFVVETAGVAADRGSPMTPEARRALQALGVEPGAHESTPLARSMIDEAEAVFGMTRSHVSSARALEGARASRVELLDPSGADVADPIGAPLSVYIETARTLRTLIEKRLRELGP